MSKEWFTADLHLGHRNVIRFCDRPFRDEAGEPDVDLMDRTLVSNWNSVVADDDIVRVVGDFAYHCHPRKLRSYFDQLKGIKELIIGNHDKGPTLALPWSKPPVDRMTVTVDGTTLVLDHYALRVWKAQRYGVLHAYGHSHGSLPNTAASLDVGVDCFDYFPVDIHQIRRRLAETPVSQQRIQEIDHHLGPREPMPD